MIRLENEQDKKAAEANIAANDWVAHGGEPTLDPQPQQGKS